MERLKSEKVIRKHLKLTEETVRIIAEHSKKKIMNEPYSLLGCEKPK